MRVAAGQVGDAILHHPRRVETRCQDGTATREGEEVPLSSSGDVTVYCGQASGTVHLILDVDGYFQ